MTRYRVTFESSDEIDEDSIREQMEVFLADDQGVDIVVESVEEV